MSQVNTEQIKHSNKSPTVICVRRKELKKKGFDDFKHWNQNSNHIYIGRNMSFYVPGTVKSKWANPFSVKKYGRDGCLKEYERYIRDPNNNLLKDIHEFQGMVLGCWCNPEACHGDVLVKIYNELYM